VDQAGVNQQGPRELATHHFLGARLEEGEDSRHVAPAGQVAAAGQIVDGDGDLAWLAEHGQGEAYD
jgi:hypothetical protein